MAGPDEDKQNKTEEPTDRKLRKAREKGDVPSSREAGNMMAVLALFGITVFLMPHLAGSLTGVLARVFDSAGQVVVGEDAQGLRDLGAVTRTLGWGVALVMAPVMGLLIAGAAFGVLIQGETVVALERIRPQLSRISLAGGFKRIVSVNALVEFLKSIAKVAVVASIASVVIWPAVAALWQSELVLPESLPPLVTRVVGRLLILTVVFLAALAIADILWKRFQWLRKQRMTLREVSDEHKDSNGDPQIKAKRVGLRRARARQRLATAVPRATVVLTNPTHYAVALRYESGTDPAPVCVAKGTDLMAAQIRKLARENDVPVVENRALARALYDVAEVDAEIPVDHWQAVAEIIGYVLDLRRRILRQPPAGSSLRTGPE
jgi:flagellar biosynthetic protein FlhB